MFAGTCEDSRTKPLNESLHPRNSKLALPQFVGHGWRMANFRKELRAIRGKLQEAGWSTQDWASDADIAHSTLWRILDRAQTPSLPTYLALLKSADKMIGEKKIASAQNSCCVRAMNR